MVDVDSSKRVKPWFLGLVTIFLIVAFLVILGHNPLLFFRWLVPIKAEITVEVFDAIAPGMTEKEVVALIGGPAGNYRWDGADFGMFMGIVGTAYRKQWTGYQGVIWVWFDDDGKVVTKHWLQVPPEMQ